MVQIKAIREALAADDCKFALARDDGTRRIRRIKNTEGGAEKWQELIFLHLIRKDFFQ